MRIAGLILLFGGLTAGAFFTVRERTAVDWLPVGICAAAAVAGVILVRSARRAATVSTETTSQGLDSVTSGLDGVTAKLEAFLGSDGWKDVYGVHDWIDGELMEHLNDVVESREMIAERYGLDDYGRVMTDFAGGERDINRAWCASADGYIDEVKKSLERARAQMTSARDVLAGLRAR